MLLRTAGILPRAASVTYLPIEHSAVSDWRFRSAAVTHAGAVRALCSRAILLNGGKMIADGHPSDVLNRYQKIIMAREEAYEAAAVGSARVELEGAPIEELADEEEPPIDEHVDALLRPIFRHGDGSAEVLSVELLNAAGERVEFVESGEPVAVRLRVRFDKNVEDPVFGFLIRNRHGIHIYGTNTDLQALQFGAVSQGEIFEVIFRFECWLAPDSYSITVASHSLDAISFDWLDSVLFFRVVSGTLMEGVANLHATASARHHVASHAVSQNLQIDTHLPTEIITRREFEI